MPCKDAAHAQHIWPTAPQNGSDTITFCIHPCEFICFYCPQNTFPNHASALALKRHVRVVHLEKRQYPGVIVKLLNEGPPGRPKNSTCQPARPTNRIIVPRDRKPAKITVPVSVLLPPAQRLEALHNLLQIKPAYQDLFRDLASQHLFNNYDLSQLSQLNPMSQKDVKNPLAVPSASFLQAYGSKLWPSDPKLQAHLFKATLSTQPGNFWAFKYGQLGPEYKVDGIPTPNATAWWRKKLGGRVLTVEESIGLSKFGAIMLVYFGALSAGDGKSARSSGQSELRILDKIIGQTESTSTRPQDVDRDSSPDIPLRITSSRSKSKEAQPSAIVVFPGLANRWRGSDAGKTFCVPKGCVHDRRDSGVMVGCENDKCSAEWFHPECVGLEGRELKDLEWTCSRCRNNPDSAIDVGTSATGGAIQRLGSTDALLASMRDFVDNDQEVEARDPQEPVEASVEDSTSIFVSKSPSANLSRDGPPANAAQHNPPPRATVQIATDTITVGGIDTLQQSPTSAEQAASDDIFIAAMQSSLSTSPTSRPAQIKSVLTGLSANLRLDTQGEPEQDDAAMVNEVHMEPDNSAVQAPFPKGREIMRRKQHRRKVRDQLVEQRFRLGWETSSTGVQHAMQNIAQFEQAPSFANFGAGGFGQQENPPMQQMNWTPQARPMIGLPQQQRQYGQPSEQPTVETLGLYNPFPARPLTALSRQQSLAMPPPPAPAPRQPYLPQFAPILPSQPLPQAPVLLSPRFTFAPVEPLPHHLWVLPTPETTFQPGATTTGECTDLERARIAHYLALTGGMGGLPLAAPAGEGDEEE